MANETNAAIASAEAAEELWRRETHQLVLRMFRARLLLVPLLAFILVAFVLFDPEPWKLAVIGGTEVLVVVMFGLEERRLRRAQANELTVHINLLFAVVVQSLLIYVTGGIASPLLVVFVPLAAVAGLSLVQKWRAMTVVAIPMLFVIVLALGAWTGWMPVLVPAFFQLDNPLSQGHAWLFTRTGVVLIVLAIGMVVGMSVRTVFERVVRGAIQLRQGALETLESRNQEILSTSVTIAHELKNPLSSIQGLARLMSRRAECGTKDRERLDVMLREIGRMTTVLDEFRSFSRPLSGLTHSPVSLSELVAGIVALHEGSAARRGLTLVAEVGQDVTAECDGQKVKQALVNLIQNALESSPGGAEVRVAVQRKGEDRVVVQVIDSGPGIAPQLRDRLFTPGFTTKERGTGIGLVVARSVVEQHGGTLTLDNRSAGGCTATMTLPLRATATTEVLP